MRWWLPLVAMLMAGSTPSKPKAAIPFDGCAHAHNDYEHPRPLLDALDAGFCSIEVDVFLVQSSNLLVAHDLPDVDPSRTLRSLYLDPLRAIAASNGGMIRAGEPLILLIDVKSDGAAAWPVIAAELAGYSDLLTSFEGTTVTPRAVTALISGNRDRAAIEAASLRYAAMDGRTTDLGGGAPVTLIPLISDQWFLTVGWSGAEPMNETQRAALQGYVAQAHAENRILRFYGAPDDEVIWREMAREGVDLIGADDLQRLRRFLDKETAPATP